MRVATDVGGTFTDLVYFDDRTGKGGVAKVDTTPPDFERGVMDALRKSALEPSDIELFAHGTTVVINALRERRGARTGLVTTRGFRDVLEIARGNRPDLVAPKAAGSIPVGHPFFCRESADCEYANRGLGRQ
jgi:N-methylhydantoinase A